MTPGEGFAPIRPDPDVDLSRVIWLGGAQWAGKTTVSFLLSARYPIVRYHYDYHDARSHSDRARAEPGRYPHFFAHLSALDRDPDEVWVSREPREMADGTLASFRERFAMALDDLARMPTGVSVIADGWGFRPELVAPLLMSPRQAIFLVPTEEFREHQLRTLERARTMSVPGLTDPARAQRNRVNRDRLIAEDLVAQARRLNLRVVEVDGSRSPDEMTALVEEHVRPFLPQWIY